MTLKYDSHGRPYEDLTEEHKELTRRVKELENSLSIALEINDKFQRESIKLTKRAQEAEGELTIIKGIGNTSPEIKALQKENKELKKELVQEKVDREYDKAVHATELEKALQK